MKIGIFGAGYVGYSLGVILADTENVTILEIDKEKIELINHGKTCLWDTDLCSINLQNINLKAAFFDEIIGMSFDYIIIAVPTDLDTKTQSLRTSIIEGVIDKLRKSKIITTVIIKSTVPIGFTKSISKKYPEYSIIFIPEFIREGHTIEDNRYPSRIVYGLTKNSDEVKARRFVTLLKSKTYNNPEVFKMNSSEAEAVKLFSNAYLAMRIAFFNELDSFAVNNFLDTKSIISAIGYDERIGNLYNNPSFGYGGYCLPKDTLQLAKQLDLNNSNLIRVIEQSNRNRLRFISEQIIKLDVDCIGVYKITTKLETSNSKNSPIIEIINLVKRKKEVILYEPSIETKEFNGIAVVSELTEFKNRASIILANRVDDSLLDVKEKVYTRDISKW